MSHALLRHIHMTCALASFTPFVLYILLGMTAFKWGRTQGQRLAAWFAAQAVFFYIVGVALTKSPSLTLAG